MPLTGYLGTGVATDFFFMFEVPKFEDTALFRTVVDGWMGLSFEEFEVPIDYCSGQLITTTRTMAHPCARPLAQSHLGVSIRLNYLGAL